MIRYNTYTKEYLEKGLIEGDVVFDSMEECVKEIAEMVNHVINMAATNHTRPNASFGDMAAGIKISVIESLSSSELDTAYFFKVDEEE